MNPVFSELNNEQQQAVLAGDGPLLILAGAGSGKTRVLTFRIAHLIAERGLDPGQILAVTFTNKAAAEMRERVLHLLERIGFNHAVENELWVSTFHSACVRILRSDIHHLGYSNQFTIYDDMDQRSVIKACLKELNISDSSISPKAIQSRINRLKNDGIEFDTYEPELAGHFEDIFAQVFARYTEALKVSSALDFADLILKTVTLFQEHPNVLRSYQKRFPYLLIDEYQDTNRCQYLLMKLLAGTQANLCAVGDEDQSIYRWRGADISNILNFEKDFPKAQIFKLEQNYRSTQKIIEAASHVISYNTERRDKQLWTDNEAGELITVHEAYDEHDEAQKVVQGVMECMSRNVPLNQVSIFYRTNAQSRVLEDLLRAKTINYEIYGGLKFYDRLEIKDTLAYLKLLSNMDDDVSFRRIVNVPARGIGAVSVQKITRAASERRISHYELLTMAFGPQSSEAIDFGRANKKLRVFYDTIEKLRALKTNMLPSDLIQQVLEETGYRKMLIDENTPESVSRLENLAELRQSVIEYELRSGADNPSQKITLEGFLQEIALVSDIDRFDPSAPALKMMTIHMAKGLEFNEVFIVGLEEELFPNIRPWEGQNDADVEEERRLLYVGMTRARQRLNLLYAKNRTVFGTAGFRVQSRFLEEIPPEYITLKKADYFSRRRPFGDRGKLPSYGSQPFADEFSQVYDDMDSEDDFDDVAQDCFDEEGSFRTGARVVHPTFGQGIVRRMMGEDKVVVEFAGRKMKKLSLKFGQLKHA